MSPPTMLMKDTTFLVPTAYQFMIYHGLILLNLIKQLQCLHTPYGPIPLILIQKMIIISFQHPILWSEDTSSIKAPVDFHTDDTYNITNEECLDSSSKSLYALDLWLHEMKTNCTQFYTSNSLDASLLAHMDAGSMASTTNCLDYLWDFQSLMVLLQHYELLMTHHTIQLVLVSFKYLLLEYPHTLWFAHFIHPVYQLQ